MTPSVVAVEGRSPALAPGAWIAPGAVVVGSVELAENASVWYGSVLRGDTESISIGAHSNIQDGTIIHADPGDPTVVGARVTVGHQAVLHGAVVEDDCLIGMGATILNGARIGRGSMVGAGALVLAGTDIPPGSVVLGAPGRVIRPAGEVERTLIEESWREYVEHAASHRTASRPVPSADRSADTGVVARRLAELGIVLPTLGDEVAAYQPSMQAGQLLWTSGQLPIVDGALLETGVVGPGPGQVAPERAVELARVCAINALATVAHRIGSLDRVRSIPKVMAFVASDPSFTDHSVVVNGFSRLLTDVLGEAGNHARSAVGVASLPLGSPIEIEAVFEIS